MSLAIALAWMAASAGPGEPPRAEEAIIITGERVRRRARDTASSVAVISERDIAATSADRLEQLLELIPNVQLGNGSQGPAIRGQDTTGPLYALPAFLGGNRSRTTVVIDGRATIYNEFVFGAVPAWDIERVEVFRTPQTTTQGQNSIAGAIFVHSNDPVFEPEAQVRAIAGNYHLRQLSAAVSGPLTRDVALRLAGDLRYQRTTSLIADRIEGGNPNHDVYGLARAKLLVKPRSMPDSRLLVTYTHNRSQAPQLVQVTPPFEERRDAGGFYGTFQIRTDAVTAAAHHGFGRGLTTDLTVSAGNTLAKRLAFPNFGQARNHGHDWSGEGLLSWSPAASVHAVGGVSRTQQRLNQSINLARLNGATGRFRDLQESLGMFGEAEVRILPRTTLTAGLRYQVDRQKRAGALTTADDVIPLDYDRSFKAWLPKLSLAFDFSKAVRAGLLVQRATNPGGTTLRFDTASADLFDAESLWDFEIFGRAELADRLNLSANLFYYAMHNAQRSTAINVVAPGGLTVGFSDLFNAPRAHSLGGEAELAWRPTPALSLRLSAGVLGTRLDEAGPGYAGFEGKEFSRSPHLSASGAIDWQPAKRLRLSAQARAHSSYFGDDLNGPAVIVPGTMLVDARAEYRFGRVSAFVAARNLFDRFALLDRNGSVSANPEDPRMVSVGIEAGF